MKRFLLFVSLIVALGVQAAEQISIAQFLLYADTQTTYRLRGEVQGIDNTIYGNFTLVDETASIYIYGLLDAEGQSRQFASLGIVEGDTVTLEGVYYLYGTKPEITSAQYISHVHSGQNPPPPVTGSLRVCAQNLENYYYNYTESERPSYNDAAGFRAKTVKIVNAMLTIDADIYAFCEVEAKPIVLQQLADSMNAHAAAAGRYAAVSDYIDYTFGSGVDNHIKSGFIYRTDRVGTVGNNTGAVSGNGYYAHTMRIQAFKQLSSNEKLVISMNHFKAKDSSADQGEATRQGNANNLVNAIGNITVDPDILILGDLNCEYGEAPITTIVNAGFVEQLLRFDENAYSHCYGGGELIDHVLANASMHNQIVNAYVKHICTWKCSSGVTSSMSYSDHDPYIVEINLGGLGPDALETTEDEAQAIKILREGQLIIIRGGVEYTITGIRLQ